MSGAQGLARDGVQCLAAPLRVGIIRERRIIPCGDQRRSARSRRPTIVASEEIAREPAPQHLHQGRKAERPSGSATASIYSATSPRSGSPSSITRRLWPLRESVSATATSDPVSSRQRLDLGRAGAAMLAQQLIADAQDRLALGWHCAPRW